MSDLLRVTKEELSKVENNAFNEAQLAFVLSKTPESLIRERPAKGGGKWKYVDGAYVRKVLNLMFGWDWDFEVIDQTVFDDEVVVKGRLTVRTNGKTIIKTQFGNKDIIRKRLDSKPISIGNDMKSAATDALKKCAQDLGIAADVYSPDSFKPVQIHDTTIEEIQDRFEAVKNLLPEDLKQSAIRIMSNQEQTSYNKLWNQLKKY